MVEVYHGTYAITWVDPVRQLLVLVMLGQVLNLDKPQQLVFDWTLSHSFITGFYFQWRNNTTSFPSCQNFIALSNQKQAIAKLSVQTKSVFIMCLTVNTHFFEFENCLFQILNGFQTYLGATVILIVAIFKTVWQLHQSSQKLQTTPNDWSTHSLNFEQVRK